MSTKIKTAIITITFLIICILTWVKPQTEISDTELRKLAQAPKIDSNDILTGQYMDSFEKYALDQFPFRDMLRGVKAFVYLYVYNQSDNNGIYIENGYAAKMEYPYDAKSVEYACNKFNRINEMYLAGTNSNVYYSIIPDKNYFLAKEHNALSIDYDTLTKDMQKGMNFAHYIDIFDSLRIQDYYRSDTHWNQLYLFTVATKLLNEMGNEFEGEFKEVDISKPYYGVYHGQMALPIKSDTMSYLTNDVIDNAIVTDRQNSINIPVYDESRLDSKSPYDLFLGGSLSLVSIDNPAYENADTEANLKDNVLRSNSDSYKANHRNLIVIRDSFASSLIPLLIKEYEHIDLVDIRYIQSERLGEFIDFEDSDVLFIYSVPVLNNSYVFK